MGLDWRVLKTLNDFAPKNAALEFLSEILLVRPRQEQTFTSHPGVGGLGSVAV